jgi:hypothetical protein
MYYYFINGNWNLSNNLCSYYSCFVFVYNYVVLVIIICKWYLFLQRVAPRQSHSFFGLYYFLLSLSVVSCVVAGHNDSVMVSWPLIEKYTKKKESWISHSGMGSKNKKQKNLYHPPRCDEWMFMLHFLKSHHI